MASPSEDAAVEAVLRELIRDHDKHWCSVDLAEVADLWEHDDPAPIYVGDEYAEPLIGQAELERHWARLAGRLKAATVSSTLHRFDMVDDTVLRAVLLSRWRLTDRDGTERTGASWITWLLVRRGGRHRIVHQMESHVYLPDDGA